MHSATLLIKTKVSILLASLFISSLLFSQRIYTIGPMFHLNFGNKTIKTSWGIEAAVWDYSNIYPYGFDVGIEWQKSKFRFYSEGQTGITFAGTSIGLGAEFQKGTSPTLFLQGSVWANAFIGIDLRFRTKKEGYLSTGIYTKIPIIPGGIDSFNKEYKEKHPNNTSSFDFDDDDD